MNKLHPIYTAETECQDCCKCVRHCPVKAIRIENGRASVVPELCIVCGQCVSVCPVGAKRIRDDGGRARHLLERKRAVYVSLAPSWVSEFEGVEPARMITAIRRLGFAGVSETALGAEQVSAAIAESLAHGGPGVVFSSACPVAVSYFQKYRPQWVSAITPLLSPALTHARLLRQALGDDIGVVFIGPCIAKKQEADRRSDLLDLALTFADLHLWFENEEIDPRTITPDADASFAVAAAVEGRLYPIEGGMIETIRRRRDSPAVDYITLSGIENFDAAIAGLEVEKLERPTFVECLACPGGCVKGPASQCAAGSLAGRLSVLRHAEGVMPAPVDRPRVVELAERYPRSGGARPAFGDEEIRRALRRVGKTTAADELNCGGCGYNTCREFARAILEKKAEPAMCVSFMRRQALRKANALLRCMPTGGVIVDRNLQVIESNEPFARVLGEDALLAFDASTQLAGAFLDRLLPFADLFREALDTGEDVRREHMPVGKRLMNVTIFTIEPQQVVGAIVEDVTQSELRREQIANKAREVIRRNIATVQDVACRLGEHMAETEILLRSIAEDYPAHEIVAENDDGSKDANGDGKESPA